MRVLFLLVFDFDDAVMFHGYSQQVYTDRYGALLQRIGGGAGGES